MRKNFRFQTGRDISGEWNRNSSITWAVRPGSFYFLLSWCEASYDYGLLGVFQQGFVDVEQRAQSLTSLISDVAGAQDPTTITSELVKALASTTPGWILARASDEKILLWRDPVGRLPVFWAARKGGIEWATRPRGLNSFRGTIRRARLECFLSGENDRGRDDYWEGVYRLLAGECLSKVAAQTPHFYRWWSLSREIAPASRLISQRLADLLLERLEALKRQDTRFVAQSGGVDSSLLLSLMVEIQAAPAPISMVDSTTERFDESTEIREIWDCLNVEGELFDIGGEMDWGSPHIHHFVGDFGPALMPEAGYMIPFLRRVKRLAELNDVPPAIIHGLGADQIFGCSYAQFVWSSIQGSGSSTPAGSSDLRLMSQIYLQRLGFSWIPVPLRQDGQPQWLRRELSRSDFQKKNLFEALSGRGKRIHQFQHWNWEHAMRALERYRRATGMLIVCPFLFPNIVEWALQLSQSVLRTEEHSKIPLRELLFDRLPQEISLRKKGGWFSEVADRGILKFLRPRPHELLKESELVRSGFVDQREILNEIQTSLDKSTPCLARFRFEIWWVIAAELWYQHDPASSWT